MKSLRLWATALTVAVTTGAALMTAQAPVTTETASDVALPENRSGLWFVELASPPTADGGSLATTRAEKQAFRGAAAAAGLRFTERYAYDALFNGLAIRIAPGQSGLLARIDGVRNVYPIVDIASPRPEPGGGEELDIANALGMTGVDVAQSELGLSGQGIRVAVMDSGVDYDHPDLGNGCFGEGCRVAFGYDFVGDAYNTSGTTPAELTPAPDDDPDDCDGHGTHVAGIIGANGAVKGVAPNVTLGAYKVFGCVGTTSADVMIAAMERVLADGMHVLNMSIGAPYQWPQYPTAAAATRLVNKGVTVVASAGNSGAAGVWSHSAPGVGNKVIGVASFDNTRSSQPAFAVSGASRLFGFTPGAGAPPAPVSGSFPLARTGTPTSTADGCAPLPAGSLNGSIALIRRGTCGFYVKAFNAQSAGAVGVVLYNNAAGTLTPSVAGVPPIVIPVVMVSAADGVAINDLIAAGPVSLTWTSDVVTSAVPTAGLISSFSSYGLSPDLSVKPDLGAPGGQIRSTYPIERGTYANLSGTSMAAPHVAGAVALLLEAQPNTPAQAVRAILQNSAQPRLWFGNPALGLTESVHRQGAGMLRLDRALGASTRVEPSRLALGESEGGPAIHTLTIHNAADASETYTFGHTPAVATSGTFVPAFFSAPATVGFAVNGVPAGSVTVPAGGTAQVTVTISPSAALANRAVYGGYLLFAPAAGPAVTVPYAGLKGDYQSIPVITTVTPAGFTFPIPALGRLNATGTSFLQAPAGSSFTMAGDDIAFVLAHFDHQVRQMRVEVFDAATGRAWHRATQQDYFPRNSGATTYFAFEFDGTTRNGNRTNIVPNGSYVLRLSVLKALGDAGNPAHWETWTSPMFVIARPTS